MISHRVCLRMGVAVSAMLLLAFPTSGYTQDINRKLSKLQLEIIGVTIDMPDGQNIGETGDGEILLWDVEVTPGDRVSKDRLMGIEHFRFAGLPVVPGTHVSFTDGLFGPERFRLGGRLTSLSIDYRGRYEVRARLQWSIYDSETSEIIVDQEAKGLAKGATLGERGQQPNALMDSVIDSLEEFLDKKGEKAIKAARG